MDGRPSATFDWSNKYLNLHLLHCNELFIFIFKKAAAFKSGKMSGMPPRMPGMPPMPGMPGSKFILTLFYLRKKSAEQPNSIPNLIIHILIIKCKLK